MAFDKKAWSKAYRAANKEKIAAQQAARNKAYYAANREKEAARIAAYRVANKEQLVAGRAAYYAANKAESAAYYAANKDKYGAYHATRYAANKGQIAAQNAAWRVANPGKTRVYCARRRAAKLQATPKWLTVEDHAAIAELYEVAACLTETTGILHEVDHVVPLQGKQAKGLHVPWNLQVLQRTDNAKKSNKLDPALLEPMRLAA